MPEQIKKDWEVEVNATIAKIGPVKGGELRTKTNNATKDLLGKLPDAGKVYLEQMMYSAYCSALCDDKTLKSSEKAKLLREYNSEVRKAIMTVPVTTRKSKIGTLKKSTTTLCENKPTEKPTSAAEDSVKTTQTSAIDKQKKQVDLKELFIKDFETLLRINAGHTIGIGANTEDSKEDIVTIKKQVYQDFASQTMFVGFYIPNTPRTSCICTFLADNYSIALDLLQSQKVEFSMQGLQPVNSGELKFSGRVFIYHEYPLFEEQKREFYSLYKSKGLAVQFRDWKYVAEKNGLLTNR
jgi:hypothetical protein